MRVELKLDSRVLVTYEKNGVVRIIPTYIAKYCG